MRGSRIVAPLAFSRSLDSQWTCQSPSATPPRSSSAVTRACALRLAPSHAACSSGNLGSSGPIIPRSSSGGDSIWVTSAAASLAFSWRHRRKRRPRCSRGAWLANAAAPGEIHAKPQGVPRKGRPAKSKAPERRLRGSHGGFDPWFKAGRPTQTSLQGPSGDMPVDQRVVDRHEEPPGLPAPGGSSV